VLCGSMMPASLEDLPARKLTGPIHSCTLDCPDAVLAARLRERPAWRGTSTEAAITQHQRFGSWPRANIRPCYDTSQHSPAETAGQIATWVRRTHSVAADSDDRAEGCTRLSSVPPCRRS
jgi:hypothetical protein